MITGARLTIVWPVWPSYEISEAKFGQQEPVINPAHSSMPLVTVGYQKQFVFDPRIL
jgi:hypothetical protein